MNLVSFDHEKKKVIWTETTWKGDEEDQGAAGDGRKGFILCLVMFKRQNYAVLHGRSSSSSSSSSSDDSGEDDGEKPAACAVSNRESHEEEEEEEEEEEKGKEVKRKREDWAMAVEESEKEKLEQSLAIQVKDVLKCRVCPKVVCLSEETMASHLRSKGHRRSLKKMTEGKLKVTLNSEGEEEEMESEGETHAERHARTVAALAEESKRTSTDPSSKKRKKGGRQRQRLRAKKKHKLGGNFPG
ncbi:hypothetical protein SELMODRAFT_409557 [Selaginella moellendorffii]|uniref:C2H2-type domain-containing protein n=1 Tax=Selaginella moellendorffii TaxID=88036 RepID=D8RBU5_SELML|nr:hypothetical protein SELMODRAFT_409557 [Selaginella moellendorffii]